MYLTCRLVCHLLLVVLVAAAPGQAMAQGTSGAVPDPITTKDLLDFGKRLNLSGQQVTAVQAMHDDYKREFRDLREGEIAELLKSMRAMQGSGMMPGRAAVKEFLDRMDAVNRRISEVDNRLFDQMTTLLTPEQQAVMPRVKQARQRDRYSSQQMMWLSGSPPVDLSDAIADFSLTPDEFQTVDAVLAPYEAKLTSDLSKLYDMTSRMIMNMYDAMDKAGLNETSLEDPETAEKAGQQMQAIWQEMTEKSQAAGRDIADLNRRTAKSLTAVLPPDPARQLGRWFHAMTYPESGIGSDQTDTIFTQALKLDSLSASEREAVLAAQSTYQSGVDRLLDQAATTIDKFREQQNIFEYDEVAWQSHQEQLTKLQTSYAQLGQSAISSLNAAIGEERAAKIAAAAAESDEVKPEIDGAGAGAIAGGDDPEFQAELAGDQDEMITWGSDQFLPPNISARELTDYFTILQLTNEQRTTVLQMHKQYREQWRIIEQEGAISALQKHAQSMWNHAEEPTRGPTGAQLDESYRLRRAALEAIQQADKAFFDDIEMAVLTPTQAPLMPRVRLARERVAYNRGDVLSWLSDGSQEGVIDLLRLVQRQRLTPEQFAALDPILQKYEPQAMAMMKARYEAGLTYMRAQDQWNIEASSLSEGGVDLTSRYRAILEAPMRNVLAEDGKVRELNRTTLDALADALPASEAFALRREYNNRAFPAIYQDGTALERQLDEALRLGDLTDEQRRKITDLIAEYRPSYESLCEKMVSQSSTQPDLNRAFGWEAGDWQKMQEREEVMEKLRFDRNELNQRAVASLKATLTEDQIKRIGGLPEPDDEEGFGMWK